MTSDTTALRKNLETEKERLENELSRFAAPTETPGNYETRHENIGTDSDENASEVETYVDNLALENNLEHQLSEVMAALKKIDLGTYGQCEVCQEEIPAERLAIYPAARTCTRHAA